VRSRWAAAEEELWHAAQFFFRKASAPVTGKGAASLEVAKKMTAKRTVTAPKVQLDFGFLALP